MIEIHLSKQQALGADPKAIQQFNFLKNLDQAGKRIIFFIIKESKGTIFDFTQETARVI